MERNMGEIGLNAGTNPDGSSALEGGFLGFI